MTESGTSLSERIWHVTTQEGKVGPLSFADMARLAGAKKIAPQSLAWKTGMTTWQPCGMIPELTAIFVQTGRSTGGPWVWLTELRSLFGPLSRAAGFLYSRIQPIVLGWLRLTRRHLKKTCFVAILIAASWIWYHHFYIPPYDDLVSLFATQESKSWQEKLKIEKTAGAYFLSQKSRNWGVPEPLHVMDSMAFAELFGADWEVIRPLGLVNASGETAILRVPEGWQTSGFTCTTGYFLMRPTGPVEIKKTEAKVLALPSLAPKASSSPTPQPPPQLEAFNTDENARPQPVEATKLETLETNPQAQERINTPSIPESTPLWRAARVVPYSEAKSTPPQSVVESASETRDSSPGVKPKKEKANSGADLEAALRRAAKARSDLAALQVYGRAALKEEFLKNGDAFLKTSRERESAKDEDGAVFYAERATATFRQGEESVMKGAAR